MPAESKVMAGCGVMELVGLSAITKRRMVARPSMEISEVRLGFGGRGKTMEDERRVAIRRMEDRM